MPLTRVPPTSTPIAFVHDHLMDLTSSEFLRLINHAKIACIYALQAFFICASLSRVAHSGWVRTTWTKQNNPSSRPHCLWPGEGWNSLVFQQSTMGKMLALWVRKLFIWSKKTERECLYRSSWHTPMIVWWALQPKEIRISHYIPKQSLTLDSGGREVFAESG